MSAPPSQCISTLLRLHPLLYKMIQANAISLFLSAKRYLYSNGAKEGSERTIARSLVPGCTLALSGQRVELISCSDLVNSQSSVLGASGKSSLDCPVDQKIRLITFVLAARGRCQLIVHNLLASQSLSCAAGDTG